MLTPSSQLTRLTGENGTMPDCSKEVGVKIVASTPRNLLHKGLLAQLQRSQ